MPDTQTKKWFAGRNVLYALLMSALLGLLLAFGWWAGETAARRLDAEMREHLLRQVDDISRTINPELARKLTFTAADKGLLLLNISANR